MTEYTIFIYRRDLRIQDNKGLIFLFLLLNRLVIKTNLGQIMLFSLCVNHLKI
jgi:hypothetical protein